MLSGYGLLPPVRLSAQPKPSVGSVPVLGEHTVTLLTELGYDAAMIENLQARGVV